MCWPLVLSVTRKSFRPPRPPQAEQMAVPSAMQFCQFSRFFPADLLLYVGKFLMGLMDPGAFHLSALNGPFWWETRLTTDSPTSRHLRDDGTCWLFFSSLHYLLTYFLSYFIYIQNKNAHFDTMGSKKTLPDDTLCCRMLAFTADDPQQMAQTSSVRPESTV